MMQFISLEYQVPGLPQLTAGVLVDVVELRVAFTSSQSPAHNWPPVALP